MNIETWQENGKTGTIETLTGEAAEVYITRMIQEGWYMARSLVIDKLLRGETVRNAGRACRIAQGWQG